MKTFYVSLFLFFSGLLCSNLLAAKDGKHDGNKKHRSTSRTLVQIVYNCETQQFDSVPPICIDEYRGVVVRYTNVNPFLHKSNLVIEHIDRNYNDGMDAYGKVVKATTQQISSDSTKKEEMEELMKDLAHDNNSKPLKGRPRTGGILSVTEEQCAECSRMLSNELLLLEEIQSKMLELQGSIFGIHQLMELDTVIGIARQNEKNRSADKMRADIAARTMLVVDAGRTIDKHFWSNIEIINSGLMEVKQHVAKLLDTSNEMMKKFNINNQSTLSEIVARVSQIEKAYSGDNLHKLISNMYIVKNKYISTVDAEYVVRGDSVLCARGDYLQLKDAGMGIDFSPIKTIGGTRIDFSVGLALSMGDVTGWNYTLNKVNDSTTYLITDKENRTVVPSPVVMMHWYPTTCSNTGLMLSFGVSPDIVTLADAKLFLGVSIGGVASNSVMRRFVLSAGLSCGATDVLKAKYRNKDREADNNFHSFGNISDSDLTEKSYRCGGFLSFTWNLGGIGH